jgi:hypothetical protein
MLKLKLVIVLAALAGVLAWHVSGSPTPHRLAGWTWEPSIAHESALGTPSGWKWSPGTH